MCLGLDSFQPGIQYLISTIAFPVSFPLFTWDKAEPARLFAAVILRSCKTVSRSCATAALANAWAVRIIPCC